MGRKKNVQEQETDILGINTDVADISNKLKTLFLTHLKDDGTDYTYSEIVQWAKQNNEHPIDESWISRVATGQAVRPGYFPLRTLARFFGVSPNFWDSSYKIHETFLTIDIPKSEEDRLQIALRSGKLSPTAQKLVLDVIKSLETKNPILLFNENNS